MYVFVAVVAIMLLDTPAALVGRRRFLLVLAPSLQVVGAGLEPNPSGSTCCSPSPRRPCFGLVQR